MAADAKAVMLERLAKTNAPAGLPESLYHSWVTIKEADGVKKLVMYNSSKGEKAVGIYIEREEEWDDIRTYAGCCDICWSSGDGVQLWCLLADCGSKAVWWKMSTQAPC
jgi:hypothetical protein